MYPKDFFAQQPPEPVAGTCFVIMPFATGFDPIYEVIRRTMESQMGFQCTRTDELHGGGQIMGDILRGIASSELVVVDVTDRNANVYYELGIAHMCKPLEKVILLSQDASGIPFDLRQFRHIIYNPDEAGLKVLSGKLAEAASSVCVQVHRIFLEGDGRGELGHWPMGLDYIYYEFSIDGGMIEGRDAKIQLRVFRRYYDEQAQPRREEVVFIGMGLFLGRLRPIPEMPGWQIALEIAPDGRKCIQIFPPPQPAPSPAHA